MRADGPLDVLLVHERFPPDFGGGGEYVVLETARHLRSRGHRVRVLTTGDPAVRHYDGIPTRRLPISRYRLNFAWRGVAQAAADADVIHAFTYQAMRPASLAARALGKPLVCGVLALFGDSWRAMRGPAIGRLFQAVERRLMRLPMDARVYLSDASLGLAEELGVRAAGDRVIEPGITFDDYAPGPVKSCVMFSGKLEPRKGIEAVLEVARRLPGISFRIIGWGEQYDRIAADCPANVRLEPFRDRAVLAGALAEARIFLFPTRVETFGLVVAEAMASGCAVVSSSQLPFHGARREAGDIEGMVEAVSRLWHDEAACRALGDANRETARRFSWTAHAERLEQVYREVIAARAGARR